MQYMLNIDLETRNVSGGRHECQSALHKTLGPHFDLTVHILGCSSRGSRAVQRPPTRYWDDNNGQGYSLEQLVELVHGLTRQHAAVHARRCRSCGAEPHTPEWD